MDLIASEGPAILGYLALAAFLGLAVLVQALASPEARRRRVLYRARRAQATATRRYNEEAGR